MSLWMSANVKFVLCGHVNVSEFQRIVGKECGYDDLIACNPWECEDKFLPLGSEGTLDIYPVRMSKKTTTYLVSGNLRDKWNTQYIADWFNRVTQNSKVIKAIGETSLDSEKPIPLKFMRPHKNFCSYWMLYGEPILCKPRI